MKITPAAMEGSRGQHHCLAVDRAGGHHRYRGRPQPEHVSEQAHCHLGLGKLSRRAGRLDEARVELATAVEMLSNMGMTLWLPEAEAALAAITESPSTEPVG